MPLITVAICTRNRAAPLDEMLASLAAVNRPTKFGLQVVVVLNDCGDDSAAVTARHAHSLPLLAVSEPKAGLSHARNTAIAHAAGDYIVWTDDDTLADRDWLTAYENAFLRHPDAALFGGTIHPVFRDGPPPWLRDALPFCEAAFAARRPAKADAPISTSGDGLPYGANYAIRTREQRRIRYDPELGRQPGRRLVGGEEQIVIEALLAAGAVGFWVPDAVVEHVIGPSRQTIAYLRSYFEGTAFVRMRKRNPGPAGMTAWLRDLRNAAAKELGYQVSRRSSQPRVWVPALIDAAKARGQMNGRRAPMLNLAAPR